MNFLHLSSDSLSNPLYTILKILIAVAASTALLSRQAAFDVLWWLIPHEFDGFEGVVVLSITIESVNVANLKIIFHLILFFVIVFGTLIVVQASEGATEHV
jgi:hypothetical protein